MRAAVGWIVVVMAGGVAACDGTAAERVTVVEPTVVSVTPEMLREGRRSYRKYCVQCHGYNGRGDGPSARALEPPPRDHTDADVMDPISDVILADTIVYGGVGRGFPGMPAFPLEEGDELVALVAYARSLSRPELTTLDIGAREASARGAR
jgi:mono/diheme cytochrome c family protein